LIVDRAAHTCTELDPVDVRAFMVRFLRGDTGGDARFAAPPLDFAPLPAAPDVP